MSYVLVIFGKIEGKENNAITMAKFIRNWVLRISVQNINYSHPLVAEITRTFVGNWIIFRKVYFVHNIDSYVSSRCIATDVAPLWNFVLWKTLSVNGFFGSGIFDLTFEEHFWWGKCYLMRFRGIWGRFKSANKKHELNWKSPFFLKKYKVHFKYH